MQTNKKDDAPKDVKQAQEQTKSETDTVGVEVGIPGLVRFFATHTTMTEAKSTSPRKSP